MFEHCKIKKGAPAPPPNATSLPSPDRRRVRHAKEECDDLIYRYMYYRLYFIRRQTT